MDPITIGLGAAGIASGLFNTVSQIGANKKNREWSESMYERQKADQLAAWGMQNEYNSPASQMKRLQEAGLNPHLVYGSGAANQAAPVKIGDAPAFKHQAASFDPSPAISTLGAYYDTKMKTAQIDMLKTQQTVAVQEALLKQAQTANTMQQTARGQFDLNMLNSLKENSLQMAQMNLRKLTAEAALTENRDTREGVMNAVNVAEAFKRMAKTDADMSMMSVQKQKLWQDIQTGKLDQQLKLFEIKLNRMGITKQDPVYYRVLKNAFDKVKESPTVTSSNFLSGLMDGLSIWFE